MAEPTPRLTTLVGAALVIAVAVGLAACSKENPSYCCTDLAACADPSAGTAPCANSRRPICNNELSVCVPDPRSTACESAAACLEPELPVCLAGICVGCETHAHCPTTAPVCTAQNLCDRCIDDLECADRQETPFCAPTGACAVCQSNTHCTNPDAPFCDQATGSCRGCVGHGDCESGICDKEAAACVAENNILYVAKTGGTGACTKAQPCVSLTSAITQIGGARKWVLLGAGDYDESVTIAGIEAKIVGPKARLSAPSGDVLTIQPSSIVLIDELEVRNATGPDADNVYCNEATLVLLDMKSVNAQDDALESTSCLTTIKRSQFTTSTIGAHFIARTAGIEGSLMSQNTVGIRVEQTALTCEECTLTGQLGRGLLIVNQGSATMHRSTIMQTNGIGVETESGSTLTLAQSTVSDNAGGGLLLAGSTFDIANSFIVDNGSTTSALGALRLTLPTPAASRFRFNTVSGNHIQAGGGKPGGLHCSPESVANTIVEDSILYGNDEEQVASGCTIAFSLTPEFAGFAGNLDAAPSFANAAAGDYHLAPGSPGIDAADPSATLAVDFDGEPRPQGARSDMGADEVVP